ncbi:MAG: hypothetical protein LBB18_01175 [Puniceicoccales bacterium]|jgi:hypothetical protein|nr:hypothetical protein [Puniceicoccales bacterium]
MIANEIKNAFESSKTDARANEVIFNATELLRMIPFPTDIEWNGLLEKLSESDKVSLMKSIREIVGQLTTIPTMNFLLSGHYDINSIKFQLSDKKNFQLPSSSVTHIANAIAKSRIVSFELLKNIIPAAKDFCNSDIQTNKEKCIDNAWFLCFCQSGFSCVTRTEDAEEQQKLLNLVKNNDDKITLFSFWDKFNNNVVKIKGDIKADPTLEFCNRLADLADENSVDVAINNTISNCHRRDSYTQEDEFKNFLQQDKGLLLFSNLTHKSYCSPHSYVSLPAPLLEQNCTTKNWDAVENFIRTVSCDCSHYNVNARDSDNSCFMYLYSVTPKNALEELGGGYASLSENQAYTFKTPHVQFDGNEQKSDSDAVHAIGIELTNPETQTFGLLNLLTNDSKISNGFGSRSEDSQSLFDLWSNVFSRPTVTSSHRKLDFSDNFYLSKLYFPCIDKIHKFIDKKSFTSDAAKKQIDDFYGNPLSILPRIPIFCANCINEFSNGQEFKLDLDTTGFTEQEKAILERNWHDIKFETFNQIVAETPSNLAFQDSFDGVHFSLQSDADRNPFALLRATEILRKRACNDVLENPFGVPKINRLCAALHAMYMTNRAIVGKAKEQNILDAVGNSVNETLENIKKIRLKNSTETTGDEQLLLEFAENECIAILIEIYLKKKSNSEIFKNVQQVDYELMVKLFENTVHLQNSDICKKMPTGCAEIVYGLMPTLSAYWDSLEQKDVINVAKNIFQKLLPPKDMPKPNVEWTTDGIGIIKFKDPEHNFNFVDDSSSNTGTGTVDLVNMRVISSENEIKTGAEILHTVDITRLFPCLDGETHSITNYGNMYHLRDKKYGLINIVKQSYCDYLINRTFDTEVDEWTYIPPRNYMDVSLPPCFRCDDFTVWVDKFGHFRICPKDDPNKISYETESNGFLVDVERKKKNITPYYLSFNDNEIFGTDLDDLLSRFEPNHNMLFYHDEDGNIKEIVLARYTDKAGNPLSFIANDGHLLLKSDPKYKLVNAPSGPDEIQVNPMLGYDNAIWLENTDKANAGVFKCLLPSLGISRSRGMTHKIVSEYEAESVDKKLFGQERYGEVVVRMNALDFVETSIQANDTLSGLRLAHIFQTQGEYESAVKTLEALPVKDKLSGDEFEALLKIARWFMKGKGHEQNGLSALVIIKAVSMAVQFSPFSKEVKDLIADMLKDRDDGSLFNAIIRNYFASFDTYPVNMQIDFMEERTLWETVKMLATDKSSIPLSIYERLSDLNYFISNHFSRHAMPIPINRPPDTDVELIKRINAFYNEDMTLGIESFENPTFSLIDISTTIEATDTDNGMEKIINSIDSKILTSKVPVGEQNSATTDSPGNKQTIERMKLSENDSKQFGETFDKFFDWVSRELDIGTNQLEEEKREIAEIKTPNVAQAKLLLENVQSRRKSSIDSAKSATDSINKIINEGRIEKTYGADVWGNCQMSRILRAYGIFVSDEKTGQKRALTYLNTNYPWFDNSKLDVLFCDVEIYLANMGSMKYCENVKKELEVLCTDDSDSDTRKSAWRSMIPMLKQDPKRTLVGRGTSREIIGNTLLFTHMTGLFPREDQMRKIEFISDAITESPGKCGALIQQVMGSGKTKVLLPFMVFMLMNRKENLPIIVSSGSQMPVAVPELRSILSGVGIGLGVISPSYEQLSDPNVVHTIRRLLEVSAENKNSIYAISSNTLLAIRTAFRALWERDAKDRLGSKYCELIIEFTELFDFLEKNGIALMDEVHITLNPKEEFIIQPPCMDVQKATIPQQDVSFITKFIYELPEKLLSAISSNTQDQIPREKLVNILENHIASKCGDWVGVPKGLESDFAKFMCGKFDGVKSVETNDGTSQVLQDVLPKNLRTFLNGLSKDNAAIVNLMHKLSSSTMEQCLSKAYGEHYGYNDNGEIVVFRNHLPTESYFQDPHLVVVSYVVATLFKGIPDASLSKWIISLAKSANSLTSSGIPMTETKQDKRFNELFAGTNITLQNAVTLKGTDVDPVVSSDVIASLKKYISQNHKKFIDFVSEFANEHASFVDRSYVTTPLDIADTFCKTISMSGTLSNKDSYVESVRTATDSQDGVLGKITAKLISDASFSRTQIIETEKNDENDQQTVGGVLGQWKAKITDKDKIKNLRIIVDYGARFKDQPARQSVLEIVNFITENDLEVDYIEFFDPQLNGFAIASVKEVLDMKNNFVARKIINPALDRQGKKERVFTFIDSPRATGTDPFLMTNAHGITTVDSLQGDFDGLLQAIMRERAFTNISGQTMDLVIRRESDTPATKGPDSGATAEEPMTITRLLNLMIMNMAAKNSGQHAQSVVLQIQEFPRRFVEMKLRNIIRDGKVYDNLSEIQKLIESTRDIISSTENFDTAAWSNPRKWHNMQFIAVNLWKDMILRLETIFADDNDLKNMDSRIRECIKGLPKNMERLGFENDRTGYGESTEIYITQQQQQQQVTASEYEIELDQIKSMFEVPEISMAVVSKKIDEPIEPTPAFEFMEKLNNIEAIGARIRSDTCISTANVSDKNKIRYESAKMAIPEKFDGQFFATKNFFDTVLAHNSVFGRCQKNMEFMLISWDKNDPAKTKCHFLSLVEAKDIRQMIENKKLTDCHLCTIANLTVEENQNGDPSPELKEFRELAMCMGNFFNCNIEWLNSNYMLTKRMLSEFGVNIPTSLDSMINFTQSTIQTQPPNSTSPGNSSGTEDPIALPNFQTQINFPTPSPWPTASAITTGPVPSNSTAPSPRSVSINRGDSANSIGDGSQVTSPNPLNPLSPENQLNDANALADKRSVSPRMGVNFDPNAEVNLSPKAEVEDVSESKTQHSGLDILTNMVNFLIFRSLDPSKTVHECENSPFFGVVSFDNR